MVSKIIDIDFVSYKHILLPAFLYDFLYRTLFKLHNRENVFSYIHHSELKIFPQLLHHTHKYLDVFNCAARDNRINKRLNAEKFPDDKHLSGVVSVHSKFIEQLRDNK